MLAAQRVPHAILEPSVQLDPLHAAAVTLASMHSVRHSTLVLMRASLVVLGGLLRQVWLRVSSVQVAASLQQQQRRVHSAMLAPT